MSLVSSVSSVSSVLPEYNKCLIGTSHALSFSEVNGYVPCSTLDHVLTFIGSDVKIRLFSILDGSEITKENFAAVCSQIKKQVANKEYPTTDHLFISIEIAGVSFLYVSLDNSVRANINGFPVYKRLSALCQVVKAAMQNIGENCVVFFSESCRPSFDGGDLNNRINEKSWFKMRQEISHLCDLEYLGECSNNEDPNGMAFGVSSFCTKACIPLIDTIFPRRILTEGFGSGAVGIKLVSEEIVWGIHFPLDFRNQGADNMGAKAMLGLAKIMETYQGSVAAVGDFNTIPGQIMQSIDAVIPESMELLFWDFQTFFGAFYDEVKSKDSETWILI